VLKIGVGLEDVGLRQAFPSMSSTVATGIRSPRMQGTPPIWSGSIVIRLYIMSWRSGQARHLGNPALIIFSLDRYLQHPFGPRCFIPSGGGVAFGGIQGGSQGIGSLRAWTPRLTVYSTGERGGPSGPTQSLRQVTAGEGRTGRRAGTPARKPSGLRSSSSSGHRPPGRPR